MVAVEPSGQKEKKNEMKKRSLNLQWIDAISLVHVARVLREIIYRRLWQR